MRAVTSSIVVVVMLAMPAQAGFFLGSELKRMCDEGIADQYVAGAYDAYEIVQEMGELPFRSVCLPSSIRASDITKFTCDYLDAEPDALMSSAGIVVAAALVQTYPCP